MRVAILIPALNEEAALPHVLAAIPAELDAAVVVIDNGSRDRTAQVAAEGGATVLREPHRGYGSACLKGIAWLTEQPEPPSVVCILDADHSDDPALLVDMVRRVVDDEADLVLSTRTRGGAERGSLTPVQIWGNRLQTTIINRRFDAELTDMGPMRAVRWTSLLALRMSDPTWGWNVEMACKALRQGLRIVEVPVTYRDRIGVSKISGSLRGVVKAGAKILWVLGKYAR